MEAKRELHQADTGVRFPRTRLLAEISSWVLDGGTTGDAGDELPRKLRDFYTSSVRRSATTSDDLAAELIKALPVPLAPLLSLMFVLLRRSGSQLWYWGMPGFRPDCRWLRRQWRSQADGATFKTFALELTLGARRRPAPGERPTNVEELAALAFLADIRAAYRPRLWRPWTWRRRCPALILDRAGSRLPKLLAAVRSKRDQEQDNSSDPLLIVVTPGAVVVKPGAAADAVPGQHAQVGVSREQYPGPRLPGLAMAGSAVTTVVVPVLFALVLLARFGIHVPGPWEYVANGTSTRGGSATGGGGTRTGPPEPPCTVRGARDGDTQVIPWTDPSNATECVGFSDGSFTFTNDDSGLPIGQQLQEGRLAYDQGQVFGFDDSLKRLAPSRQADGEGPVYQIVYFAGLTEGPLDEYDSAEAEEMEGLLVALRTAAYGPGGTGNSVSLRNPQLEVIIANGGSEMQAAEQVAQMIVKKFAGDPYFLGVVGMDRSTGQAQGAIDDFTAHRIPVLATTLSADERLVQRASGGKLVPASIGGDSPYYFQLGPSNTAEARLIMRYIQDAVRRYFAQPFVVYPSNGSVTPQKIVIFEPEVPNPEAKGSDPDLYISSMVADLLAAGKEYHQRYGLPLPAITQNVDDPALCGSSTVAIFAGRHDQPLAASGRHIDLTTFLTRIAKCASTAGNMKYAPLDRGNPFVIADDGVTRFVADTADRSALPHVKMPISYISKGINILSTGTSCLSPGPQTADFPSSMSTFCTGYAQVAAQMTRDVVVDKQHPRLLWTGERVGLAYDAAQMFLQAADTAWDKTKPLRRTAVPIAFQAPDASDNLVTGSVNFTTPPYTGVDSPDGMPLAVLRIHIFDPDALPACEFSSHSRYQLAPIPNMDKNTAACLGKSN